MRHVLLSSVMVVLAGSGLVIAQDSSPAGSAAPGKQEAALPNALPAQPVPVAVAAPVPPADGVPTPQPAPLPPPSPSPPSPPSPLPPPSPVAEPPPPPLAPTLFADAALDGFATRFWLSADYLLWWTKGENIPPLVTTGSPSDAVPGALGQPGTQILFGGDSNSQLHSGARFRGGYWFTRDQTFGIDGTFFFLGGRVGR
ncbi:MAG TPA: BBP7 family outer membrane beta-barrel protein, partial [Gemmataceae bacterium]